VYKIKAILVLANANNYNHVVLDNKQVVNVIRYIIIVLVSTTNIYKLSIIMKSNKCQSD